MEEAEQEKKMQTTESGHGNSFCLDVIGKSCSITLNVEHGRSSGCWRYLVCLKPSLPPTANIESKSRTVSRFTDREKSLRKFSASLLHCPRLISWSIFLKQQADSLYPKHGQCPVPDLFDHPKPPKMQAVLQTGIIRSENKTAIVVPS